MSKEKGNVFRKDHVYECVSPWAHRQLRQCTIILSCTILLSTQVTQTLVLTTFEIIKLTHQHWFNVYLMYAKTVTN